MDKLTKKQRHQVKSRWYYIFWGAATLSVFAGQMYVGTGYRLMSEAFHRVLNSISVEVDNSVPRPSDGNFVFFGKDVQAGTSGVIGYYAQVQMRNDSTDRAELFAVSSEIFISSK